MRNNLKEKVRVIKQRKMKVIAIINGKGGVGKTMTACNLGYSFVMNGYKVLLIDTDRQCNLTTYLGCEVTAEDNIYSAITRSEDIRLHIKETRIKNLDLVTSDPRMAEIDSRMLVYTAREKRFQNITSELLQEDYYDFVIVDCCNSFGDFNYSVILGSDYVLIPAQTCSFSDNGVSDTQKFVAMIKNSTNKVGCFLSMVDMRENINKRMFKTIKNNYKESIYETYIPKDKNIGESILARQPVLEFNKRCRASEHYSLLAKEVLKKV